MLLTCHFECYFDNSMLKILINIDLTIFFSEHYICKLFFIAISEINPTCQLHSKTTNNDPFHLIRRQFHVLVCKFYSSATLNNASSKLTQKKIKITTNPPVQFLHHVLVTLSINLIFVFD